IASNLTVDATVTQSNMLHIAGSVSALPVSLVRFVTTPNTPDPADASVDSLDRPRAAEVFADLVHNRVIPASLTAPAHHPRSQGGHHGGKATHGRRAGGTRG